MLTKKQNEEIREWLEKSQNPVFFFDNDVDGLCSFLLLKRKINRGFGVIIKSYPGLEPMYNHKLDELNPDVIFVLDKPIISKEFIEYANELGLPIVWIDHHPLENYNSKELIEKNVFYYNPIYSDNKSEPTSLLCYRAIKDKKDMWIAMAGCISDHYIPEFTEDFLREYPELLEKTDDPKKALFESEIGKIIKILSFAMKDRTGNVVKMLKKLSDIKSPYEILNGEDYEFIVKRYNEIDKKYKLLLDKARKEADDKNLLYFQYAGDLSISADLANELIYFYPEKKIVVVFIKEDKANLSLRGKKIRDILNKAMKGIEGSGGGHEDACGGTINAKDLEKFKSNIFNILSEDEV